MTPKEKAQELFDKIYIISGLTKESKKILLIAVNEILESIMRCEHSIVAFWVEVKKEIENI
jgi:hypothetical protein